MVGIPLPPNYRTSQNLDTVTGINSSSELDIAEVGAGTVNVAADTFIFNDADDGETYEEAIADLFGFLVGTNATSGLSAASGVMRVNINGTTAKTSPVAADAVMINDSAAANINKSTTVANLTKGLSPNALTAKTEPVAADEVIIGDTEASNVAKKATITNLAKPIGEVCAGTNATSALSEVDGVMRVNIGSTTAKTEPIAADAVLINDSEASNINKSATIANLAKPIGEVVAGTNATSGLSETDGVCRVNINGVTAKETPVVADAVLVNDSENSNVNKSVTLANLNKVLAGVLAGTITSTGIDDSAGVLTVRPLGCTGKSTPIAADGVLVGDSADNNLPKTTTIAELAAVINAIAQRTDDDHGSLFYEAAEIDFGTADAVDLKITDAAAEKGKLVGVQATVTEAFNGDNNNTITISSAASGATAMASTIVVDKDAGENGNWVGASFGALPNSDNSEIVASGGDVYAYRAANTSCSAGKLYFVLTFMKTA